jgi:glycosyltransferase involved in cell wall biosynthesis
MIPKISIVTVVWNDKVGLERTIQSIINQTYENIEFIIIDGGSTDGTVDVIKAYEDKIDYWVSEKDAGIYDAMNKGIQAATGTWVNFMNAGDTFASELTLKNIDFLRFFDQTLLYGKNIMDGKERKPSSIKSLEFGGTFANHQSMFFNKNLLNQVFHYDIKYKIYGDYELVNRCYLAFPNSFFYLNIVIADFNSDGISQKVSYAKRKEKFLAVYKAYGTFGLMKSFLYKLKYAMARFS